MPHKFKGNSFATVMAALLIAGCGKEAPQEAASPAFDIGDYTLVDLSHEYSADTVYWPTDKKGFQKTVVFEGMREDGWYSAFEIATAEHGGTHMDAPYHFDENGDKAADVPLSRLIAPAVVIDVSEQSAADRLYRLRVEDVMAFEAANGNIEPGSIVLLRTGWSQYWPDREAYLGGTDPANLSFPSFGADAVRFLIKERKAAAFGLDTASTDYGPSKDFPVHRILGASNVPGFENLDHLDQLPPKGAFVVALPMKIAGGSGGPLRAVALVPNGND